MVVVIAVLATLLVVIVIFVCLLRNRCITLKSKKGKFDKVSTFSEQILYLCFGSHDLTVVLLDISV